MNRAASAPAWSVSEVLADLGIEPPVCRRILLVDDEPDNIIVLETLLEEAWEVFTAFGGQEALDLLAVEGAVDLVIADQRMPGLTGVELIAEIGRHYPETVSFVLTGYSNVEPIVDAVNKGAVYRFLLKPWDVDEIRAAVDDAMELKRARSALHMLVTALARKHKALSETLLEIEQTQQHLVAMEQVSTLGRLTSGIMHDIRNQLTAMVLLTRTIQEEIRDPEVIQAGHEAVQTLESLYHLVLDVNAFARSRPEQTRRGWVDVRHLAQEVVNLLNLDRSLPAFPVHIDAEPGAEQVNVDANQLRQTLVALVRHALAVRSSDRPVCLAFRPGSGHDVWVEIQRDAPSPAQLDVLAAGGEDMEPHPQHRESELALEVARLVARAHDGSVDLRPLTGGGTLIRLVLANACRGESP